MRLSSRTEGLTVESYRDGLIQRLHALAKANTLFGGHDQHTDLAALVTMAISPFTAEDNFTVDGPRCTLQPQACQPVALVLHELSTNALKHGALSRPGGRVAVHWTVDQDGAVAQLRWTETGGPPVVAPSRKGMGSSLLASMRQLSPDIAWHRDGVECRLTVPIEAGAEPPA
jgi:two-component sensor histidine kinase